MLDWIGKSKVVNHHLDVPYHVLERKWDFGEDAASGNMVIRGDNLLALKALLPRFAGKVKCIYIDPPYNTGNEGWCYNDNVNDPQIRKWLGAVVGKEGEDFTRHDKWLCMMYPRLQILRHLLSQDGAVFISIDDNELYNLKLVCDEIFGAACFVGDISWQRTYSTRNDAKGIVSEVEHILVYSKVPGWQPKKLPRTAEMDKKYKNPDNDVAPWRSSDALAPDSFSHQSMVYGIQSPFTGKIQYPTPGRHWAIEQDKILESLQGWCPYELRDIDDAEKRAELCGTSVDMVRSGVKAIMLVKSLEESKNLAAKVLKKGPWPKFFYASNGKGGLNRKTYLENVGGVPPTNLWEYKDAGHTDEAKKELKAIFDGDVPFDTPKPVRLIERVLQIASDKDSIVLDSFAGSGTTAHAVLNANAKDGGTRRFILVEMCDYAESVTAERVKRVMGNATGETPVAPVKGTPTGGTPVAPVGFSYYELGEPLMEDGYLNERVGEDRIREYVYYTETGLPTEDRADDKYLMGVAHDCAYYFLYDRGAVTTLSRRTLGRIKTKAASYVVFADKCALGEDELERMRIRFKKIPRDIRRM